MEEDDEDAFCYGWLDPSWSGKKKAEDEMEGETERVAALMVMTKSKEKRNKMRRTKEGRGGKGRKERQKRVWCGNVRSKWACEGSGLRRRKR